jgi:acetyl-CoA carboxylase biotin carboxyl carrier protein
MSEDSKSRMLPVETLRTLVQSIEDSDIEEVDLVWNGVRLRVRQDPAALVRVPVSRDVEATPLDGIEVTAPLTGVYYARPAPDKEAFVSVGSIVVPGQTVALIETMKLFNEVPAELEGEVIEIMVAEGDLVEKGQALIRMRAAKGAGES